MLVEVEVPQGTIFDNFINAYEYGLVGLQRSTEILYKEKKEYNILFQ